MMVIAMLAALSESALRPILIAAAIAGVLSGIAKRRR
jgi:hypothetical protein